MTEEIGQSCVELSSAQTEGVAPDWVHILPTGHFKGVDGRGPYQANDLNKIIAASRDAAGNRELLLDYNHATDLAAMPKGGAAPAAGWISDLQVREDGIWGKVDWTPAARQQVANREYRYISPVFRHEKDGVITSILRASLVNQPNLRMTAMASQDTPDPTKYVPIEHFQRAVAEVNSLRQGLSEKEAEDRVALAISNGQILPWMRDWAVELCSINAPAFEAFAAGVGKQLSPFLDSLTKEMTAIKRPPGDSIVDGTTSEIAKAMGLDPKEFAAFRQASRN